jgi:hypothetical protein
VIAGALLNPVGAGLPAKAVCQAAWIFTGVHIRFFGNGELVK